MCIHMYVCVYIYFFMPHFYTFVNMCTLKSLLPFYWVHANFVALLQKQTNFSLCPIMIS